MHVRLMQAVPKSAGVANGRTLRCGFSERSTTAVSSRWSLAICDDRLLRMVEQI